MSHHSDDTDAYLVEQLRKGDSRAFEAIYRRYTKELFGYAVKKIGVREDAEEIIHDVFESLWKRRNGLRITSLKHYLFTSARYMILRYFSHRGVARKFQEHYRLFEAVYESTEDQPNRDPQAIHEQLLQHIK